jgi:hypothetical protein
MKRLLRFRAHILWPITGLQLASQHHESLRRDSRREQMDVVIGWLQNGWGSGNRFYSTL